MPKDHVSIDLAEEFAVIRDQTLVAHEILSRIDSNNPAREYLDAVEMRLIAMQKVLLVLVHGIPQNEDRAETL